MDLQQLNLSNATNRASKLFMYFALRCYEKGFNFNFRLRRILFRHVGKTQWSHSHLFLYFLIMYIFRIEQKGTFSEHLAQKSIFSGINFFIFHIRSKTQIKFESGPSNFKFIGLRPEIEFPGNSAGTILEQKCDSQ